MFFIALGDSFGDYSILFGGSFLTSWANPIRRVFTISLWFLKTEDAKPKLLEPFLKSRQQAVGQKGAQNSLLLKRKNRAKLVVPREAFFLTHSREHPLGWSWSEAYLLPSFSRLLRCSKPLAPDCWPLMLILGPTRELLGFEKRKQKAPPWLSALLVSGFWS